MQRMVEVGGLSSFQGILAMGGDTSFPLHPLAPAFPFPLTGSAGLPCTQAAAPLPLLATEGLEAGFTISLSINVNIVSAGCPGQNNSLKGHPSVLLWLNTMAPFCQVLPTHCLPIRPSVHPISRSSKEPKP